MGKRGTGIGKIKIIKNGGGGRISSCREFYTPLESSVHGNERQLYGVAALTGKQLLHILVTKEHFTVFFVFFLFGYF